MVDQVRPASKRRRTRRELDEERVGSERRQTGGPRGQVESLGPKKSRGGCERPGIVRRPTDSYDRDVSAESVGCAQLTGEPDRCLSIVTAVEVPEVPRCGLAGQRERRLRIAGLPATKIEVRIDRRTLARRDEGPHALEMQRGEPTQLLEVMHRLLDRARMTKVAEATFEILAADDRRALSRKLSDESCGPSRYRPLVGRLTDHADLAT